MVLLTNKKQYSDEIQKGSKSENESVTESAKNQNKMDDEFYCACVLKVAPPITEYFVRIYLFIICFTAYKVTVVLKYAEGPLATCTSGLSKV